MRYWVYINNEILGPHEKEKLTEVPGFSPSTLVCPETPVGEKPADWQPANTLPEIAAALGAPPFEKMPKKLSPISADLSGTGSPPPEAEGSPEPLQGTSAPPAAQEPSTEQPAIQKYQEATTREETTPTEAEPEQAPPPETEQKEVPPPGAEPIGASSFDPLTITQINRRMTTVPSTEDFSSQLKNIQRELKHIDEDISFLKDKFQAQQSDSQRLQRDLLDKIQAFESAITHLEQSVHSQPALPQPAIQEAAVSPASVDLSGTGSPGPLQGRQPAGEAFPADSEAVWGSKATLQPLEQVSIADSLVDEGTSRQKAPKKSSLLAKLIKPVILILILIGILIAGAFVLARLGKLPEAFSSSRFLSFLGMSQSPSQPPAETPQAAPAEQKAQAANPEAEEWVKSYSIPAGSPTLEDRIAPAVPQETGDAPSTEWKSEIISPGVYLVTATVPPMVPGASPVVYRFEADFTNKTIKGSNDQARSLLEPPRKSDSAVERPARSKTRATARPRLKAKSRASHTAAERQSTPPGQKTAAGETEDEYKTGEEDTDFILPGIPRIQTE